LAAREAKERGENPSKKTTKRGSAGSQKKESQTTKGNVRLREFRHQKNKSLAITQGSNKRQDRKKATVGT